MTRFNDAARVLCVAAAALSATACATITRGTTQPYTIASEPSGARVRTSDGMACDATPCTWTLPRKSEFMITVSKPGYQDAEAEVDHHLTRAGAAGFAGNIILGGLLGMGIDTYFGSTQSLSPAPLKVVLRPDPDQVAYQPTRAVPIYLYEVQAGSEAAGAIRAAAAATPGVREVSVGALGQGRQSVMIAMDPAAPYGARKQVEGVLANYDQGFRRLQ